eukprot:COSAG01_NODE_11734_length_1870_cov_1.774139_1_plen_37_part_10
MRQDSPFYWMTLRRYAKKTSVAESQTFAQLPPPPPAA